TIRTEVRDRTVVEAACGRLQLPPPIERSVPPYSSTATGLSVELPNWRYPVVCDLHTGQVRYDNFEGRWGDQAELNRFCRPRRLSTRESKPARLRIPSPSSRLRMSRSN